MPSSESSHRGRLCGRIPNLDQGLELGHAKGIGTYKALETISFIWWKLNLETCILQFQWLQLNFCLYISLCSGLESRPGVFGAWV